MANPALKNGYISIANELVEQFALHNIPGNEMRIVWIVWRKTWGWASGSRKKDWDWISYSQFEELTGLKRADTFRCVKSLVEKKIILKDGNRLSFNQNYEEWVLGKRLTVLGKSLTPVREKPNKIVREKPSNKRNKETNTKETPVQGTGGLGNEVINLFKEINASYKELYKRPPQHRAAERLVELHSLERLKKIMGFIEQRRSDKFCPSISTPIQLEDKWATLEKYALGLKKEGEIKNKPTWKIWTE